jgi:hypothetical protein
MPRKKYKQRYWRKVDRDWTEQQCRALSDLYSKMKAREVRLELKRLYGRLFSLSSIYTKAKRLKLQRAIPTNSRKKSAENEAIDAEEKAWDEARARRKIASPNAVSGITKAQLMGKR